MRSHYRAISIAIALAATAVTTAAFAQAGSGSQAGTGNPLARGDDVMFHSPFRQGQVSAFSKNGFDNNALARRDPRKSGAQVTPVPEPSQWAMMIAGLALVGFIARRNSRKSRDPS